MSYVADKELELAIRMIETNDQIDKGVLLLNKAARTGDHKGQAFFEMSKLLREGVNGIRKDEEASRRYADASIAQYAKEEKCGLDFAHIGDYYYYGYGTEPVDYNKALDNYRQAQNLGCNVGSGNITAILKKQKNASSSKDAPVLNKETESKVEKVEVKEEPVKAAPVLKIERKTVETDNVHVNQIIDAEQLTIKALRLLDSVESNKQDKLDGLELAKEAANAGSLRACALVGYIYEGNNSLVERDVEISKEYYDAGVLYGSAVCMFRLGLLTLDVESPFYNVEIAHDLILRSARAGYSVALCYIGDCFRAKVNDPRNLDLAYRYYAMAGERGYGIGYHNMAEIDASRQQLGLAQDHEKLAVENGYDVSVGYQDPLYCTLHI